MVTNNKVLTVSYGTFSCTLEGFDDSFDTMKAIAEYFRDLAADDRYFGAEPPTPDAEMLTRIAEREIERRVQARHEAGAIVLSATPSVTQDVPETSPEDNIAPLQTQMDAPQDMAEAPQPEDHEPSAEPEAVTSVDDAVEFHAEAIAEDSAPDEESDTVADTIAAADEPLIQGAGAIAEDVAEDSETQSDETDVSDILGAIAEDMSEDIDAVADATDVIASDTTGAEEFFAVSDTTEAGLADPIEDAFEITDTEEDTINLFEDAYQEADAQADQGDQTEDDADEVREDSIAAKLRRIRAVVSRAEISDDDDDDYIEDQHADVSTPIDLGDDIQVAETETPVTDETADMAAPVAETPKPRARVIRMKRAELEETAPEDDLDDIEEALVGDLGDVAVTSEAPQTVASVLSQEDEADLIAELAELDAELAQDGLVDDASPAEEPVAEVSTEGASLEASAPSDAQPQDSASEEDAGQNNRREKRRERRAKLDAALPGEEAVDRLIEEANTKLDEPEGNRRRSAIAHLRAAVAATKAEKEAGKSFKKADNSDAYRDDLAETVKPRKAAPPLKLVAEQRIDAPEEQKPSSIRPRRVSVDAVAAEANEASANFIEFAENMGATQLPDVLEAAASYLTFVEGRKKFSRPMLMRLAYQVGDERFEREAGLRSFGQLLREKKIEKIAGGRFTVSDAINFKPDDRAAG